MHACDLAQIRLREEKHWWFVARREALLKSIKDDWPNDPGLRVLDAGCGTGGWLARLSKVGIATGIDVSSTGLAFCRERGLDNLCACDITHICFEDRSFDIVTACDVLEHVQNDRLALKELSRVTRPGGRLYVTVPALMSLWSEHDEAVRHLRRYTAFELKDKMTQAGFVVDRLSYRLFLGFPVALAGRTLNRWLRRHSHREPRYMNPVPSSVVNGLLLTICRLENYLMNHVRYPWGVSLIAVAVRR